jgi:recombination protein RecR
MEFSSKSLDVAVNEISKLPGIGRRSALRLALYLLKQPKDFSFGLSKAINDLRENIIYCKKCYNISDKDLCQTCSNPKRNQGLVCVVQDIRDVMAIESTSQYNGLYHVLGGLISPMDGIGPSELNINPLVEKINSGKIEEVIFALSSTMEADTTNFYIYKKIESLKIKITTISRGISVGDELEYTDEVTLGRSILSRIPFENSISKQ